MSLCFRFAPLSPPAAAFSGALVVFFVFFPWAAPARAACPPGAPSCTTFYEVQKIEWALDLSHHTEICQDLEGAEYQAFKEEDNIEGLIGTRVFHPINAEGNLLQGPLPVALLVPGNGLSYAYYDSLLAHIAGQGIMAVSLQVNKSATSSSRADVLLCGLRFMMNNWDQSEIQPVVAFLGHSRGGEGAVMAANRHHELELLGSPWETDIEIRTVAALAPSANCEGGGSGCLLPDVPGYSEGHANLADEAAASLFVIQGTRDGDVDGDALRIYEDASSEGPGPLPNDMTKAMIFTYQVGHNSWGGSSASSPNGKGAVLARAYVGSFLSWWLTGKTEYRRFFTGEATPPCLLDPIACGHSFDSPEVFLQYREGAAYNGQRLRIHDFETPQLLNPSYIGPVKDAPLGSAHKEDVLLYNPPHAGKISTEAVVVTRGTERESELSFKTGRHRDFSHYSYLSLRLGKPALKLGLSQDECVLIDSDDLDVGLTLIDGGGDSHEIRSSHRVRIAPPDLFWGPIGLPTSSRFRCLGYDHLTTVRVPLIEYWQAGVNPVGVDEVLLTFELAPADGKVYEVYVDSLELTINDLDPHCGNGVVEAPEVCDLAPPAGQSCEDLEFDDGDLACNAACLPDTSSCVMAVCGNGIIEGEEECDDGNLEGYDYCTVDCTVCPAGDPLCGCLGTVPEEQDPSLPFGGVLGDGLYCHDDVLFGGLNRCVLMAGGQKACISSNMNSGPFCPCNPHDDSCFAEYDPAFDSDVAEPQVPAGSTMRCEFALRDPDAPGGGEPANSSGYCFAEEESIDDGGAPEWFFDWYCESWFYSSSFDTESNFCLLP